MNQPNPNGANQSTSDPREQIMWDFYVRGLTSGIENAHKAALDAGYSEDHSRNITLQGWFKERVAKLKRKDMLSKAERNLDKALDYKVENDEGKLMPEVAKIVVDVSKTIVSTLGKSEGYSTKVETEQNITQKTYIITEDNGTSENKSLESARETEGNS
jgi:phage terminase small subunit